MPAEHDGIAADGAIPREEAVGEDDLALRVQQQELGIACRASRALCAAALSLSD